jgi:hypothetical protein
MLMRVFIGLSLIFLAGCHRGSSSSAPPAPGENLTGQQRVVGATPVLRRTITFNDLHQLDLFIKQAYPDGNTFPKSLNDLPGFQRDAPNLAKYISDGDLILFGGKNGVVAYSKAGLEVRSPVLLKTGIENVEPDELKKLVQ